MYPVDLNGVYLHGIYIHEPSGLISNFLMAIFGIYCFVNLRPFRNHLQRHYALFLLFLGLASVGGIFTHGFPTHLGEQLFFWAWFLKNSLVPVANYFAAMAIIPALYPESLRGYKPFFIGKAIVVVILLYVFYSFLPAVADLAVTYIFALILSIKAIGKVAGAVQFRNAFVIAILSGTLYLVKYDIDPLWLNHKDIVHVFVLFSIWFIYKGVKINQRETEPVSGRIS